MSGLLRRLTRRRPATADEPGSETPGANEPAAAPADDPALGGSAPPAQPPVSGAEWATGTFGRAEQPGGAEQQPPGADEPTTTSFGAQPGGTDPSTGEPPRTAFGAQPGGTTGEPPTTAFGAQPGDTTGEPPTTAFGAHAGLSSGDPLAAGAAGAGASGALGRPVAASADQPTQIVGPTVDVAAVQPQQLAAAHTLAPAPPPTPGRDLPAGVDPAELQVAPAPSARRGRLRRRLRYLRRVRELLLRDLGGFFYEVHRTAGGTLAAKQREIAEAKSARLTALDAEVRALEARLGEPHAEPVLSEPGIGGACDECGELYSSDAHFCFRCGNPLDDRARAAREATIAAALPAVAQDTEPGEASVLWAGGPRSETPGAPPRGDGPASPSTSEWLLAKDPAPAAGALFSPAPSPEPAPAPPPEHPPATDQFAAAAEASAAASEESAAGADDVAAADETNIGDEPIPPTGTADETTVGDEPIAPTGADEVAAADEEPAAASQESVARGDEVAAPDETTVGDPATGSDEVAVSDERTIGDEPIAGSDEPAAGLEDPVSREAADGAIDAGASVSDEAAGDDQAGAADEPTVDEPDAGDERPSSGDSGSSPEGAAAGDAPDGDGGEAETRVFDAVDEPNGRVTSGEHVRRPRERRS